MANCTQCGAPVTDDLRFCSYCGTRLNIVDESLGKLILSNTEAIKQALSDASNHYGVSGKYLEPISFKDLNSEYYMPLLRTTDETLVVAKLNDGNRLAYQIVFADENPVDWAGEKVEGLIIGGQIAEWFAGWLRCPECLKRYHITRADPSILMRIAECPRCAVGRPLGSAQIEFDELTQNLARIEGSPVDKPGFLSTESQRDRYRRQQERLKTLPARLAQIRDRLEQLRRADGFVAERCEQPLMSAEQAREWREIALQIRD